MGCNVLLPVTASLPRYVSIDIATQRKTKHDYEIESNLQSCGIKP